MLKNMEKRRIHILVKNQEKKDFAFLNDKKLIKKIKKENYKSKLKII